MIRNAFWGILGLFLLAPLVFLAGCAAEGYQRSAPGDYQSLEYKYYQPPTSGGAMIGPPPEAGR